MNLPLHSLLAQLQQAGFRLDPSEQIRIQQVLHQFGAEYLEEPEELRRILGPLIAKTPEEQARFQRVFQEFMIHNWAPIQVKEVAIPTEEAVKKKTNRLRLLYYALGIVLILTWHGWQTWDMQQDIDEQREKEALALEALDDQNPEDISAFLDPTEKPSTQNQHQSISSPSHWENMRIQSSGQLVAGNPVEFYLVDGDGKEPIWMRYLKKQQLRWEIEGRTIVGNRVSHLFDASAIAEVKVFLGTDAGAPSKAEHFIVLPASFGKVSLLTNAQTQQAAEQQAIKLLIFLLAVLAIFGIEGLLYYHRRRLLLVPMQHKFRDRKEGPEQLNFSDQLDQIQAEPALVELAQRLQLPESGNRRDLHVASTLYATVRAGGFPDLKYLHQEHVPEYLVLVDEAGPSQMEGKLFASLLHLLEREGVALDIWHYRNDPRECYQSEHTAEYSLEDLASRYGHRRLLIFGKGTHLVDPVSKQLHDWVEDAFLAWEKVIFFTPEPLPRWSFRERALQQQFRLMDLDMSTQEGLAEALLGKEDSDWEAFQRQALIEATGKPNWQDYDLNNMQEARDFLGDRLFEMVAASAVLPTTNWQIGLQVQRKLDQQVNQQVPVAVHGQGSAAKLSFADLQKLSRLPWYQEGHISSEIQAQLLAEIDPNTQQMAREAVLELLEEMDLPEDSPAYRQRLIEEVRQQAALHPDDPHWSRQWNYLQNLGLLQEAHSSEPTSNHALSWAKSPIPWKLVGGLFLPALLALWVNWQTSQYSGRAIVERHMPATEEWHLKNLPVDIGWWDFIPGLTEEVERESSKKLAFYIESMILESEGTSSEGRGPEPAHNLPQVWESFQLFALIGSNQPEEEVRPLLQKMLDDPDHLFHYRAKALAKDYDSFWRW
ncbi:MAG: hypothetical protein AAF399_19550 [Bacteroidota bacterium]